MNRLLLSFYFTFCAVILFAQDCYNDARNLGIEVFKQEKYTEAIEYFKQAHACSNKPANNDLSKLAKRANDNLKKQSAATETPKVADNILSDSISPSKNILPEEPPKITDIEMVFVEGGTFKMGCNSERTSDCYNSELPIHEVKLSDFYIGKYEVTQAQWLAVMDSVPSFHKGDSLPVENVSWNEVLEFIRKLNTLTGKQYRLPTEAEWEYAARGGNKSSDYKYSGSNDINEVAWYDDNSDLKTHPVGQKQPNELGIYDMSGNVSEWCGDWFSFNFYQTSKKRGVVTNPRAPTTGTTRVIRGGSCFNYEWDCTVWRRSDSPPDVGYKGTGFRLVHDSK